MRKPEDITIDGRSLADVLVQHTAWLRGDKGGVRADLKDADLTEANLRGVDLGGADLEGAYLQGANLTGADLRNVNLGYANLRGADLRGADVRDTNLKGADLKGVDLRSAYLVRANLKDSNLGGAVGNMSEVKSAHFDRWSVAWTTAPHGVVTLQIGCHRRPLEMWRRSDPRWIAAMDPNAPEWWSRYRDVVLALVDASPATPWGKPKEAA